MAKQHPANQLYKILLMAAAHGQTRAAWGVQLGYNFEIYIPSLKLEKNKQTQKNVTRFCVAHKLNHYIDMYQRVHLSAGRRLEIIDYTLIVLALMLFEFTEYAKLDKIMRCYQLRYILAHHFGWVFDYTKGKQWAI